MIDFHYSVRIVVSADPSAQTAESPNSSLDHVLDCVVEALRDAMDPANVNLQTIIDRAQSEGCAASGRYVVQVERAPITNAAAMFAQIDEIEALPD